MTRGLDSLLLRGSRGRIVAFLAALLVCFGLASAAHARADFDGVKLVDDLNPGSAAGSPDVVAKLGGKLIFVGSGDPEVGYALWSTDGTEGGTELVRDLTPGQTQGLEVKNATKVGDLVYFMHGGYLWKTDGTDVGTQIVREIPEVNDLNYEEPDDFASAGDRLVFCAYDAGGFEPWASDGTAAGTHRILDLNPGPEGSCGSDAVSYRGKVYFDGYDGTGSSTALWRTDGTATGTELVQIPEPSDSGPLELQVAGSRLFFSAFELSPAKYHLWVSDGTTEGTSNYADLEKPAGAIADVNGTAFLAAADPERGVELWKTDGTPDGTSLVKDITPGTGGSQVASITAAGDKVFFTTNHGDDLWVSDGTEAGTKQLATNSDPMYLASFDGALYLQGRTGSSADDAFELWRSDGTVAGTGPVADIRPGAAGSHPLGFVEFRGTLFFSADDGTHGREMWRTVDLPETSLDQSPEVSTKDPTPTFDFSSDQPGATFECSLVEGGSSPDFGPCSGVGESTPTVPLPDGEYTFAVRAVGPLGDVDPSPETSDFEVDTSAPAAPTLALLGTSSPANDNAPVLSGDAEDGSTVAIYADPACQGSAVEVTADELADGVEMTVADDSVNRYSAIASDEPGNASGCSESITYVEDSTSPAVAVIGGPAGPTFERTPQFSFTTDEPGASVECGITAAGDPTVLAACSGPAQTHTPPAPLADGSFTFRVQAIDAAGNVGVGTRDFSVATKPPDVPDDPTPPVDPDQPVDPCAPVSLSRAADRFIGSDCDDVVYGLEGDDVINGAGGDDQLLGAQGADRLTGGPGADRLTGGPGRDRLLAVDGSRDRIDCGPGRDRVRADRRDKVVSDCEDVDRKR